MDINNKYQAIINAICEVKGISEEKLLNILQDNNCRYLLYLFIRKYNCTYDGKIKEELDIKNIRKVNSNLKKGREKFLINKDFREMYFEIDQIIENVICKNKKII